MCSLRYERNEELQAQNSRQYVGEETPSQRSCPYRRAKWCGKTTTEEEIAASKIMLAKPDIKDHFRSLLEIDSDAALAGETPIYCLEAREGIGIC